TTSGSTAGGTTVVLTGTGFTGATGVSFGSVAAASFTVNSATQITATSPSQAAGTVDVRVATPSGISAAGTADHFTYTPGPAAPRPHPARRGGGGRPGRAPARPRLGRRAGLPFRPPAGQLPRQRAASHQRPRPRRGRRQRRGDRDHAERDLVRRDLHLHLR